MRVAVAGSGLLAAGMLHALAESSHTIVAVVQNGRRTKGWRRRLVPRYLAVVGGAQSATGFAVRHGVPVLWIDRLAEDLDPLRAARPDVLLVGGFDIILKRPALELPAIGCVNAHSSLLPKHRGPNPFCGVLLAGERETGVTFHRIDEGIDTGDILDQTAFPIESRDTAVSLYGKACCLATERVVAVMDRIEKEGVQGRPQNHSLASYDPKPTDETMRIDWTRPAEEIDRRIRAFAFAMAWFTFRGRRIRVRKAAFDPAPIKTEPGTVLDARAPVRIATGNGVLMVEAAYSGRHVPWVWPGPANRPKPGEKVS